MSKFPQRITATVTLEVYTEGLDWELAKTHVEAALMAGNGIHDLALKKVIGLESLDEDR